MDHAKLRRDKIHAAPRDFPLKSKQVGFEKKSFVFTLYVSSRKITRVFLFGICGHICALWTVFHTASVRVLHVMQKPSWQHRAKPARWNDGNLLDTLPHTSSEAVKERDKKGER